MPYGRRARWRDDVDGLDGPELERPLVRQEPPHLLRYFFEHVGRQLAHVGQTFGPRHLRHRRRVLESFLGNLKRRRHVEDRLAVLDRDDAAVAEALTVARELDLVDDRRVDVTTHEEVRVQRVDAASLDRVARGRQRLAEHLATEYSRAAEIAALAPKDPILDALELEQLQEIGEDRTHASATSCRCDSSARSSSKCPNVCHPCPRRRHRTDRRARRPAARRRYCAPLASRCASPCASTPPRSRSRTCRRSSSSSGFPFATIAR